MTALPDGIRGCVSPTGLHVSQETLHFCHWKPIPAAVFYETHHYTTCNCAQWSGLMVSTKLVISSSTTALPFEHIPQNMYTCMSSCWPGKEAQLTPDRYKRQSNATVDESLSVWQENMSGVSHKHCSTFWTTGSRGNIRTGMVPG